MNVRAQSRGLTSWNGGEVFASLGIGHFIWYPAGREGPFEESFPKLATFLVVRGESVPGWMRGACPWKTQAEFKADFQSPRMVQLRNLLKSTIALYRLVLRRSGWRRLAQDPFGGRRRRRIVRVSRKTSTVWPRSPLNLYALMDYVNFKGKGVSPARAL